MNYRAAAFMSFFIFSIFCSSCKLTSQQNNSSKKKSEKYKVVAEAKLQKNIQYVFNGDKSCVLCVSKRKLPTDTGQFKLFFILYDLKSDEVIFEAAHLNATVKWISNDQIQVFLTPGIVSGREGEEKSNSSYIYDIKIPPKVSRDLQRRDK